jgi:hypothetical protein
MKNIELKFILDYKKLFKKIAYRVVRKSSIIILFIGIAFLGYSAYIWYQKVYAYGWDELKKQEYMNNKNAGTNLNRVKFEKTLKEIERRRGEYDKNIENIKDVFRL